MAYGPELTITFPGGKRVDAELAGRLIPTDQSRAAGGEGSAPEPFALFLASIGTCAGIYVLSFCQTRNLPTEGIRLTQRMEFDPATRALSRVHLDIHVPPTFPEKYRNALVRAADGCAVKRAIQAHPEFVVQTVVEDSRESRVESRESVA
ncbi:MAG: OsmC family protein [Myxococcales bacterium]|jgi:putative redox protein